MRCAHSLTSGGQAQGLRLYTWYFTFSLCSYHLCEHLYLSHQINTKHSDTPAQITHGLPHGALFNGSQPVYMFYTYTHPQCVA